MSQITVGQELSVTPVDAPIAIRLEVAAAAQDEAVQLAVPVTDR